MARLCRSFPSSNTADREQLSDEFSVMSSSKEAVDEDENEYESDNTSDEGEDPWSLSLSEPAQLSFESLVLGSSSVSNARPYSSAQQNTTQNSYTDDGLRLCTESLGFESSDEREDCGSSYVETVEEFCSAESDNENDCRGELDGGAATRGDGIRRGHGHGHGGLSCFPPPLSSMGPDGQPAVVLKPLRKDGRFLLQEVNVPRHERLHAWRQDGRLRLQLVAPGDQASSPSRDAVDECAQGTDTCASLTGDGEKRVATLEEERVHVDCYRRGAGADVSVALYQEALGRRCHGNMASTWKPRCITT